jgi:hypothetical protein
MCLGGCGLNLTGTAGPAAADDGEADAVAPSDGGPTQDEAATPQDAATDEGPGDTSSPSDASDARDASDAAPPPDPAKVTVSYAAGKDQKVYSFDMTAKSFVALPSNGCPVAEESAVLTDGTVYVTSSDNKDFYKVTSTGCTSIRMGSNFPYALGTAPVGTASATEEWLVGYMGAGDYVRVDTNGNVTTITPGALGALRPSGDVTAIGTRGFLAALTGSGTCPSGGDCVVEVDLKTGTPIKLLSQLPGLGIYGIAHGGGQLLLYANSQVYPYDVNTKTLLPALAGWPAGANFSGAGAPPYPPH